MDSGRATRSVTAHREARDDVLTGVVRHLEAARLREPPDAASPHTPPEPLNRHFGPQARPKADPSTYETWAPANPAPRTS